MAFTPEHDQWVKEGLINATFTLHVLPMGRGFHQWGHVEELPVDVYYCDFEQYDPPAGFPRWDVCCVRTNAAWWVVLTEPLFVQLAILSQDGQLPQEFFHTITFLNERHIGAWLWVRDRGLSGDEALAKMDQRMIDRYGENYRAVKEVLDREVSVEGSKASMMFGRDLFLHEPMVTEGVQKEVLDYHRRSEPTGRESGVSRWGRKGKQGWQELLSSSVFKWASVLVFLILVLMVEGPRTRTIARRVYGPVQVDLEEHFPAIEWSDYTGESLWDDPVIAQALHQALVWRNPYLASTPIQSIKVAKLRQNSMTSIYRWTVVSDEMAEDHQTRVDMEEFSGRQLRALQNAVSGYKSLHLILCSKLILLWGGQWTVYCLVHGHVWLWFDPADHAIGSSSQGH